MEDINNNIDKCNQPKINYDDKKYDVFFSFMVPDIDPTYLDEEGKIELVANSINGPFKCFSIQIAKQGDKKTENRKIYTKTFGFPFGYEFDINDRSFNVKFGGYKDVGSSKTTDELVNTKQDKIGNKQYVKNIDPIDGTSMYIWNKELNKTTGKDIRDIMVPKIISRLETANEVAKRELNNQKELTEAMYAIHKEKNSSHNSSFTEDDYGSFEYFDFAKEFFLRKMHLAVFKNKNVSFQSHNEVGVASKDEDQAWVLPKRLIFNTNFFNTIGTVTEANIDKYISEFCEANKIYKSDIRIIDEEKQQTQVVSPRQFKDILLENIEFYNKLTEETKQKLDEMVQICEKNNGVDNANNSGLYEQKSKTMNNNNVQIEDAAKSKDFNI